MSEAKNGNVTPKTHRKHEPKVHIKKPACKLTNRPKEVVLIRGKDPSCRQAILFNQHAGPVASQNHPSRGMVSLSERPVVSTPNGTRSRDADEDDAETDRKKKKPRNT